jgi:hypothetical protein
MPSKRVRPRKGSRVKEIVHPPPTRRPIDGVRYANQWVAIYRREIVDSGLVLEKLIARLRAKGIQEESPVLHVPRLGVRRL